MLHSLEIKNYRNLRHLVIPKLGRVNLVIGKNNTGKSSLLEAVAILNTNDIWKTLSAILGDRGEIVDPKDIERVSKFKYAVYSLMPNLNIDSFYEGEGLEINASGNDIISAIKEIYTRINLGYLLWKDDGKAEIVNRFDESNIRDEVLITERRLVNELNIQKKTYSLGRQIGGENLMMSITEDNFKYVSPSLVTKINSKLWDQISLTDHKETVIKTLHLVDPKISDLDFNSNDEAFIRHDELGKLPLKRMGDGINRILTIILKMVTCGNGYLLIDEFENGLHYSVQEKLWEIIFQLAEKLNIQVFATTHSNDTIKAFESLVNSNENYKDSQLIKLINVNGEIKQETADAEDLEVIVDGNIDPR